MDVGILWMRYRLERTGNGTTLPQLPELQSLGPPGATATPPPRTGVPPRTGLPTLGGGLPGGAEGGVVPLPQCGLKLVAQVLQSIVPQWPFTEVA